MSAWKKPFISKENKMAKQPLFVEKHLSRSMMIIVLWAGLFGVAVQFFESVKDLAVWIGLFEFFCLVIASRRYDEREQQLLSQSYSLTFQWLAVILLAAYGFLQIAERFNLASAIASFLNTHWIGMTVSMMGVLLGVTGVRLFREG
jgi:hypothetical protein